MTAEIINIERAYIARARIERAAALAMKLLGRTEPMVEHKLRAEQLDARANAIANERAAARRRQENQRADDGTFLEPWRQLAGNSATLIIHDEIQTTAAGDMQ